jgi:hypothetical protein
MSWIVFDLDQPGTPDTYLDCFSLQDFSVQQDTSGQWWVYGTLRSVPQNVIVYDFRDGIRWQSLFNGGDSEMQEHIIQQYAPRLLKFRASGIV